MSDRASAAPFACGVLAGVVGAGAVVLATRAVGRQRRAETAGAPCKPAVGSTASVGDSAAGTGELKEDQPDNANAGCVGVMDEAAGKAAGCAGCPNQGACASGEARKPDPAVLDVKEKLKDVKRKILVLSGKGGVGKSTVSAQLSFGFAGRGMDVGLLDVDICGPSLPRMLGLLGQDVHQSAEGWSPVYVDDRLAVMSIGFMLPNQDDAIIWRGPRKNGLIKQFLTDVTWGALDVLVIDTPPGTSDEHLSIVTYLQEASMDGAVIVTTPQEVALMDVRKEINFCRKVNLPIIGVVENMSGYCCPKCGHEEHILAPTTGGAEAMCLQMNVPFLGRIPLDGAVAAAGDAGKPLCQTSPDSPVAKCVSVVMEAILKQTDRAK